MTQWPVPGSKPDQKGDPDHTFPGFGDNSAFANVTMETFDQGDVRKGCMNCHNATRDGTDFLWSLKDHAFPPNVPGFLFLDAAFQNLKSLLKDPVK
jgi:hypothetical protein